MLTALMAFGEESSDENENHNNSVSSNTDIEVDFLHEEVEKGRSPSGEGIAGSRKKPSLIWQHFDEAENDAKVKCRHCQMPKDISLAQFDMYSYSTFKNKTQGVSYHDNAINS